MLKQNEILPLCPCPDCLIRHRTGDAEPVAWQGVHEPQDLYLRKPDGPAVRPLYTAPPSTAQAVEEALIKAALDAAAEKVMLPYQTLSKTNQRHAKLCADAIRQITPQQVMERMK